MSFVVSKCNAVVCQKKSISNHSDIAVVGSLADGIIMLSILQGSHIIDYYIQNSENRFLSNFYYLV